MDLKVLDKELLDYNNIRIISATLMISLTRRSNTTEILEITHEYMGDINILYHIRNPEILKNIYLVYVDMNTYWIKKESLVSIDWQNPD